MISPRRSPTMPDYEPSPRLVERMAYRPADMSPEERATFVLRHTHAVALRAAADAHAATLGQQTRVWAGRAAHPESADIVREAADRAVGE